MNCLPILVLTVIRWLSSFEVSPYSYGIRGGASARTVIFRDLFAQAKKSRKINGRIIYSVAFFNNDILAQCM